MADVSYLKINERSNVENEKGQIWGLTKFRVMRNIENKNNSKIWQFFENLRNFENLLIF